MNPLGQYYFSLSEEDKLFVSKIADMNDICCEKFQNKFSFFLDERQILLAESVLNRLGAIYAFWGGYDDASRKILGVFPFNDNNGVFDAFPIVSLAFKYRVYDKLTHRDFLGSFMSKQITRCMVGDIVVNDGYTVAFVYKNIDKIIINECIKIGSVGVRISYNEDKQIQVAENFLEIKGTVSSLRLDCIISLAIKISREKAVMLIKSGNVSVQYEEAISASKTLNIGDVISIRGYGKFIFSFAGEKTKKGRIPICIKKYV